MSTTAIINILVGVALLLFGRRMFWVFAAGVGFVAGALLATQWVEGDQPWLVLAIALAAGIVGALLTMAMQYVVVGIVGFLAGAYLGHAVALAAGFEQQAWIAFLGGGVVGAVLVMVMLNWALILLSSLLGATVIVQNCGFEPTISLAVFAGLTIIGILVQGRQARPPAAAPVPRDA